METEFKDKITLCLICYKFIHCQKKNNLREYIFVKGTVERY